MVTSSILVLSIAFLGATTDNDTSIDPVAIAVPVAEAVSGAALLFVVAPAIASTAANDFGSGFLLALSVVPGAFAVAIAVTTLIAGIMFATARQANDDCGVIALMNDVGKGMIVAGIIGTLLAPLAFSATLAADEALTGHVVDQPARPMIAATIGATAGVAVFLGGAWGHDSIAALDEPLSWLALMTAAAGVSVVGATTGYVLAR